MKNPIESMPGQFQLSIDLLVKTCREVLAPAQQAGDESTVALVSDRMRVHEKTAWMLRALQ